MGSSISVHWAKPLLVFIILKESYTAAPIVKHPEHFLSCILEVTGPPSPSKKNILWANPLRWKYDIGNKNNKQASDDSGREATTTPSSPGTWSSLMTTRHKAERITEVGQHPWHSWIQNKSAVSTVIIWTPLIPDPWGFSTAGVTCMKWEFVQSHPQTIACLFFQGISFWQFPSLPQWPVCLPFDFELVWSSDFSKLCSEYCLKFSPKLNFLQNFRITFYLVWLIIVSKVTSSLLMGPTAWWCWDSDSWSVTQEPNASTSELPLPISSTSETSSPPDYG